MEKGEFDGIMDSLPQSESPVGPIKEIREAKIWIMGLTLAFLGFVAAQCFLNTN